MTEAKLVPAATRARLKLLLDKYLDKEAGA
jgi:hypothetical protein